MSRPVVFYAPHADDETLNMGITIAEHVAASRPTYVVLMTTRPFNKRFASD
jgi:LmbE family N-acetylglucosaminyl deacetylase